MEELQKRLAEIRSEMDSINAEIDNCEDIAALEERANALIEERKEIEAKIAEARAEVDKKAEIRAKVAGGAGVTIQNKEKKEMPKTIEEIRASQEYLEAYANAVKTGDDKEVRSLLSELVSGTVPVPTTLQSRIETMWEKTDLAKRAHAMFVKGVLRVAYEKSATGAVIHTEGGNAPAEEELVLDTIEISPRTIKKWISVSDEALAMSPADFLNYIYDEITYQILLKLDSEIVNTIKASTLKTTVTAAPGFDMVFKALATLQDGAKNPIVILNKKVFYNDFMPIVDLQGRPIYNVIAENGKAFTTLNGCEVVFSSAMPATATGAYAIVGDMDGVIANYQDGQNVSLITDPYSLAEKDLVKVVGNIKVGLGVAKQNYFCVVSAS